MGALKIKKLKKLFNIGGLKNAYQQNKTKQ
uniref:Uncharacterized protein n=1 Tax=Borrelia garinii subsp. bavariensis (strain ATCC BAA-2496 / DSM 23469 / PBi) TaxID=290434 RepID=A0A7M4BKX7_BORGP|nr:hypothetical protein BGP229 [Borreliella bavariensis PBi]